MSFSKEELLRWLEEDEAFRQRLAMLIMETPMLRELRALAEQVARNTEAIRELQEQVAKNTEAIRALQEQVAALREDFSKRFEEHDKQMLALRRDFQNEITRLREDFNRRFEEFAKEMAALREDFNRLSKRVDIKLSALGRRWGLMSEEAFRAAMSGMLEDFGFKVMGRLVLRDEWGIVDPEEPGALYEYDLCISQDGREWVVEIKAHVSWEDVAILKRKARLYERCRGVRPLVAVVSPFVEEEAKRKAEKAGFKVFTYEEEGEGF